MLPQLRPELILSVDLGRVGEFKELGFALSADLRPAILDGG